MITHVTVWLQCDYRMTKAPMFPRMGNTQANTQAEQLTAPGNGMTWEAWRNATARIMAERYSLAMMPDDDAATYWSYGDSPSDAADMMHTAIGIARDDVTRGIIWPCITADDVKALRHDDDAAEQWHADDYGCDEWRNALATLHDDGCAS